MANATAPDIVWIMCGFVSTVWDGALHAGNGCPHDLGAGHLDPTAASGDPAWFSEDELWFDGWGLPSLARPAVDVAYGTASYVATGGDMHNYYMWHGGNHYGNWSLDASDGLEGPSSSENTVRYANAAVLRSDGSRHEPLFSATTAVHEAYLRYAECVLETTPERLDLGENAYALRFSNATASLVVALHVCGQWNACLNETVAANATVLSQFVPGLAGDVSMAFGSAVAWDGVFGEELFDTSRPPDVADAPIICDGALGGWETWTDDDATWFRTGFSHDVGANETLLLDLAGLGKGRVFLDGAHVTNYDLTAANCSCPDCKPRCGARQLNGTFAGVVPEPNAPGDGSCGDPSQRYYHVYPEAAGAATILVSEDRGGVPDGVQLCGRRLFGTPKRPGAV